MTARYLGVSVLWTIVVILCWPPIRAAFDLGLHDDRYVSIIAAPLLFAFFMYWERARIFAKMAWAAAVGIPLLLFALSMYAVFLPRRSYQNDGVHLSLAMLAVVLAWMACFLLCYGRGSFRAAYFPFCCLLLTIPVPVPLMDKLTVGLQHASATMSFEMLRLAGIPVYAQGMKLFLPNLTLEVAPECSGIRSLIALTLVALVAGRLFLRYGWTRLALALSTIPIAILKNALRISVIAWLSAYVDRKYLHGSIHRNGGLVFTPLAAALLLMLLVGLRRFESWMAQRPRWIPHAAPAIHVIRTSVLIFLILLVSAVGIEPTT
jgi:exosortase